MDPADSILDLNRHRGAQGLLNCHVFAKREHLVRLELAAASAAHRSAALTLHAVAGHEHLFPDALRHAQCIILEVDPGDPLSLARMEQVRKARPTLPIIAAIENADFNLTRLLVRQGVFDVVSLPFDITEVMSRVMDASATLAAQSELNLSPMVAVANATGATGATTVITHLASAISHNGSCARPCCVVDLDLQFGQVANYLGVSGAISVVDLLDAGERLDEDLVRNAAVQAASGPFVLAAPMAISPLEQVDTDQLLRLLDIVRQEYGFVLIDLPANWTSWTLSALLASSEVLLLTDQSINGLRQAKRCLELFDTVELPAQSVGIIVNRFERKMMQRIGLDDIRKALKREVKATLAREKNGLGEAQDQGLLLGQTVRKARMLSDIESLADELCAAAGNSR